SFISVTDANQGGACSAPNWGYTITASSVGTPTPTVTSTSTRTFMATNTPTPTQTLTPTNTATPTQTFTPTNTATPTPVVVQVGTPTTVTGANGTVQLSIPGNAFSVSTNTEVALTTVPAATPGAGGQDVLAITIVASDSNGNAIHGLGAPILITVNFTA